MLEWVRESKKMALLTIKGSWSQTEMCTNTLYPLYRNCLTTYYNFVKVHSKQVIWSVSGLYMAVWSRTAEVLPGDEERWKEAMVLSVENLPLWVTHTIRVARWHKSGQLKCCMCSWQTNKKEDSIELREMKIIKEREQMKKSLIF